MRIALVITPFDDHNLQLARQIGVTDIVVRYPGPHRADLEPLVERVDRQQMRVSVVEGYLPLDRVQSGSSGRAQQIDQISSLIESMAALGVGTLCYNWMGPIDATRTSDATPGRGGALCTEFDLAATAQLGPLDAPAVAEAHLWQNLAYFLERVLPVAECAGVVLAMHPDDPPLSPLRGSHRIMTTVAAFERLAAMDDSPANGICFCQGTFAAMGVDVPTTIGRLGRSIAFVHVRDVRGTPQHFVETFHDEGPTDMYAAMCAYRDIGFAGAMRPDHVPRLIGEEAGPKREAGYTMRGRLFAVGYLRGLIEATAKRSDG